MKPVRDTLACAGLATLLSLTLLGGSASAAETAGAPLLGPFVSEAATTSSVAVARPDGLVRVLTRKTGARRFIGPVVLRRPVAPTATTAPVAPRTVTAPATPAPVTTTAPAPTAPATTAPAPIATVPTVPTDNPFAGRTLYAAPALNTPPGQAAARLRTSDPERAAAFDLLAKQPTVYWFGDWNATDAVRADVDERLDAADARGQLATILVYNIMHRDGGHYSAGGASSLSAYKAWIDQVAAGIAGRRVPVIVEPDAVNDLYNMSGTARTERAAALRYAITTLAKAGASPYLDGGGVGIHSAGIAGPLLKEAGIDLARGFSLNVSNFKRTEDTVAYGRQVSALVGGKPFVVDTARNGNGPLTEPDAEPWCNPPGRAIGRFPTTAPATAGVDAFLWVKEPGNSDGECRGFPRAGTFVEDYAYELVVNSRR